MMLGAVTPSTDVGENAEQLADARVEPCLFLDLSTQGVERVLTVVNAPTREKPSTRHFREIRRSY